MLWLIASIVKNNSTLKHFIAIKQQRIFTDWNSQNSIILIFSTLQLFT